MEQNTLNRLKIELESFKGLVIANLLGAAFTIAFSMAYGVSDIIPFITGGPLYREQLPYVGIIVVGFSFAINWITRSAELMDEHDDITTEFQEIMENRRDDDEAITSIIIKNLAFYREKSNKIEQLKWGSRITGTFLLFQAGRVFLSLLSGEIPSGNWMVMGLWFAFLSNLIIGVMAWYVPVIIRRFIETWDARLNLADEAGEKLGKILEDAD